MGKEGLGCSGDGGRDGGRRGGGKSEDSFSGEYVLMCGLMW